MLSFTVASSSAGSAAYQKVEIKCDALNQSSINVTEFGEKIKLNGNSVDSVECDNLEAYTYPRVGYSSSDTYTRGPQFLLLGVLPASIMFSVGIIFGRRYSFEWPELGKILGTSAGLIALMGVVIIYLNVNSSAFGNTGSLIPILLFTGPLIPSILTYYRENNRDDGNERIEAILAFTFSIMIYWVFLAYLMASYTLL